MLPLPSKSVFLTVLPRWHTVAAVACQLYAAGWNVKIYSGSVCRNQSRLFLLRLHCFLYSQHVSSSPAVVHVSLPRSALTVAGAVGYKGKLESTQRQHTEPQCCTFHNIYFKKQNSLNHCCVPFAALL